MRVIVAAAIAGALVLGLLNACASARTTPVSVAPSAGRSATGAPSATAAPAAALDLLPTVWHVHGAVGADPATYLLFTADGVEVLEPKGFVGLEWATQGDQMLATVSSWATSLGTAHQPTVPWLTSATTFRRTGAEWVLRGVDGHELATLTDDGPAPKQSDSVTTPEPVTSFARAQVATAVAGPGVQRIAASSIVGRFGVVGLDPKHASLTLTPGGAWTVAGGCPSGTGTDLGGGGEYRVLDGGFLLVTSRPTAGVGCAPAAEQVPADAAALERFDEARSLLLEGDRLTLFDRMGKRIGTLTRLA